MSKTSLHASCVAINGRAVLLVGASGIGKSDVALRLIDGGAVLVSDDQTCLSVEGDDLIASPPDQLAGLIEARHVGLLRLAHCERAAVSLYVELVGSDEALERLPEAKYYSLLDRPVRWLKLRATDASTPAKIRLAIVGSIEDVG